ncbi:hypothetical protein [Bacillus anthracis]|nr:hypothetical protein [Bacillus anthracis]RDV61759.1 hypothetical protein DUI38_19130 [Bacillus anthracis]
MKKLLEVVGAVLLAFVDGKKVAMELNETPEQPLPKREESSKQIQPLKAILHTKKTLHLSFQMKGFFSIV